MAFGNAIKKSNIVENWLFQFGYFNGDAQGNGDGGFSAITQADGSANLLNEALDNSETGVDVDDGTVFSVGDHIKVDSEIMKVSSISSNTLTVARGAMSTTKATHNDNTQIYWENFFPVSFSDTTYNSVFYFGSVLNRPTIRESIDLAKSTSKTSNISVSIPDFNYEGNPVSQELFGGTNKYINQEVKVLCQVDSDTPNQIGSFRLIDISTDGNKITLSLTSHRPWDFIKFPQDKTTISQVYFPVVYGEFSESDSSPSAQDLSEERYLYPVKIDNKSGKLLALTPRSYDGSTHQDGRLHHYEKDSDQFVPIDDSGFTDSTESYQGGNAIRCRLDLNRGFKAKPKTTIATEWSNSDNVFDSRTADSTTFASDTLTLNQVETTIDHDLELTPPNIVGKITEIKVYIKYRFTFSETTDTTGRLKLIFGGSTTTFDSTSSASDDTHTSADLVAQYNSNDKQIPNIKIRAEGETDVPTETITTRVYDVQLLIKVAMDESGDSEGTKNYLDNLENMYIGANGLTESWSGSNGEITLIHEAHRDMLVRFTNMTTATPTGWSDLESSKDWKIRYWKHDQVELQKELEKLQYEGGFIFRFAPDGTPQYIHIKDSYSSVDATLSKHDISNINVNLTPFSELLTKQTISYEKHPAEDRYLTTVDSTNAIARGSWNIKTKENTSQQDLDIYVSPTIPNIPSSNPNDDFYTYYDNIFGDIKIIVSFEILNPIYYGLDVGNVISFDNSNMYPETPLGYNSASWSSLKFMIIRTNRTPGKLSIEARRIA